LQVSGFTPQSKLIAIYPKLMESEYAWNYLCKMLEIDPSKYKDGVFIKTIGVKEV
jgi:hypothetical protein